MGKLKMVLIVFVFLILTSTGTIYFYVKNTSKDMVSDPDIEEIIETRYTFELPEDRETSPFLKEEVVSNSEEDVPPISKESRATDKASTETPEVILDKYRPAFDSLETQANRKIDALVEHAISDYNEKNQTGEKVSLGYLYQKYSAAAKDLEAKTDQAFSYILSTIEKDLDQHGFSVEHAKEYKELYEALKKERRTELIEKAKERVL